ncbi:MAG: dihydropteroate synthase [Rhodoferax sp.]|uniref:dihydropteroate synthase n=1 Tax=Rhodoferax sp. TaxID=50421 RepID=UPI00179E66D8|nr:dihydropteroate synthase [Rhodoferax sp.]NMM15292.1 dihydropteroate synthase [Rhodoferax sp.]NMM21006.1 dihydropteroate synthase [Rhodoferax sp.]
MKWITTRFLIDLTTPQIMGIVNVTPDSFSDGGQHASTAAALRHCEKLINEGADILDIGGETTRPGSLSLPLEEELTRVLPVVREAVRLGVPVSVDTYKPQVMQAVLDLGADIINDIWALRWTDSNPAVAPLDGLQVVSRHPSCGVCLMHMHREPLTMQSAPMEGDVVAQVRLFLDQVAQNLQGQGVDKGRIVIDPGIGFGKTVAQNFALLKRQNELLTSGYPLLAGWSRKSSLAAVTGIDSISETILVVHERMVPSVAAALLAVERGASIVRVHDVRETVQAIKVLNATK